MHLHYIAIIHLKEGFSKMIPSYFDTTNEVQFSVVTVVSRSLQPQECSTSGFPVYHQLPKLTQTVRWVGEAIQISHLLSSPSPPASIFPSIRDISNKLAFLIRWPNHWSFSFSISPSNDYSGLISFRMDWLDLLAVQGTLKSLLQYHSSKASILQCSTYIKK